MQTFDFDLGLTGFSEDELGELLAEKAKSLTDEVPESPAEPVVLAGRSKSLARTGSSTATAPMLIRPQSAERVVLKSRHTGGA